MYVEEGRRNSCVNIILACCGSKELYNYKVAVVSKLSIATQMCQVRGIGTGPADPAIAGPMFEPTVMIHLKS